MTNEELLWADPQRPTRGPKPALSRQRVVRAAIKIADAEGLGALSMQRLGQQLGYSTMALYRHVPGKDQLITLMLDAAVGEPPAEVGGGWRDRLEAWSRATRDVFVRHPWLLAVVTNPRVMGPNETAWVESALRTISSAGLPPSQLFEVLLVVNGYIRGAVAADPSSPDRPTRTMQVSLASIERLDGYPTLSALLRSGALAAADNPDEQETGFEFGLRRVLDGIELFINNANKP